MDHYSSNTYFAVMELLKATPMKRVGCVPGVRFL